MTGHAARQRSHRRLLPAPRLGTHEQDTAQTDLLIRDGRVA